MNSGGSRRRGFMNVLGPLEMVKPWNTKGVEGVYRFWSSAGGLYVDEKKRNRIEQKLDR